MANPEARFILSADDRTKIATASAQRNLERLNKTASALKTTLVGVGAAFVIQRAAGFTRDTLGMADALGDTAEKAGLTAEQLQVLRFAAEQNGSSADKLDKAMLRLNASIGQAGREALGLESSTSPASQAMESLGVSVLDASGNIRSSGEVFPELIDKIAAIESPAERAAVAAKVFGMRIGPELGALINQGSAPLARYRQQLSDTGALLSNELVAKAGQVNDQFNAVGAAIRTNFQAGFLQAFVGEFGTLEELITDPKFVQSINDLGRGFGDAMQAVVETVPIVLEHLRGIPDVLGSIVGLGSDAPGVIASLSGELKTLAELWVAGKILAYTDGLRQVVAQSAAARDATAALATTQRTSADAAAVAAAAAARQAESAVLFRQMRVAEAQAAVQSASGMNRLAVAQTQLLPAQAALNQATQAHNVALANQVAATRASSAALVAQGQAARVAGAGFVTLSGIMGVFGSIVTSIPILLTMQQVGRLVAAIADHRDAVRGIADAYDQFARAQSKAIGGNEQFAAAQIQTTARIAGLTRAEQDAYAERLRGAQAYWRAVFELEARRPDGDQTLAKRANQQVRAYSQALNDLRPVLDERLQAEQSATDRLATLKAEETKVIETELARQKTLYDAANRAIEEANKERDRLTQDAADLVAEVSSPGVGRDATLSDARLLSSRAAGALNSGDLQESIRLAKQAGDVLRDLNRQGQGSASLRFTAKQVADTQTRAAQAQAAQITAEQEAAKARALATIQDLANQAAVLKTLPVGFDSDKAIIDAQSLRAALQAELAANPIVVPVVLDRSAADTFAQSTVDAATVPGRAHGGYLPGRSPHARADNLLFRGTAGELLIGRPEVEAIRRQHGEGAIASLLRGRLPGYALGGLLGASVPRPPLPAMAAQGPPRAGDTINLTLPGGGTYAVQTDRDTSQALQRDIRLLSLKSGKR